MSARPGFFAGLAAGLLRPSALTVGVALAAADSVAADVSDEDAEPLAVGDEGGEGVGSDDADDVADAVAEQDGTVERPVVVQPAHGQSVGAADATGQ